MSTHALKYPPRPLARRLASPVTSNLLWLAGGFLLSFLIPFVLADTLEVGRDLYYGVYAAAAFGYFALWVRTTGTSLRTMVGRRLPLTLTLAAVASALLVLMVYRTEDATSHPTGLELWAAVAWRGVVYGAADGLLLSAFPILAVFAAFAGTKLRRRRGGPAGAAPTPRPPSPGMPAVSRGGSSHFRSAKIRKPLAGDVV